MLLNKKAQSTEESNTFYTIILAIAAIIFIIAYLVLRLLGTLK